MEPFMSYGATPHSDPIAMLRQSLPAIIPLYTGSEARWKLLPARSPSLCKGSVPPFDVMARQIDQLVGCQNSAFLRDLGLPRVTWDFTIVTEAIATYDWWCVGKVVTKEL